LNVLAAPLELQASASKGRPHSGRIVRDIDPFPSGYGQGGRSS
jgi:hypothetical protein